MIRNRKLVYGVGINDAEYPVTSKSLSGKREICPFYATWANMLKRCYCEAYKQLRHGYADSVVCEEWKRFSVFRDWMQNRNWKGNHLDKDLLIKGNNMYCPESCIFISPRINSFLLESSSSRGEFPIGVSWNPRVGKFMSYCSNVFSGKRDYLGYYDCPYMAHSAWLARKLQLAELLAAEQTDVRISVALVERYKNYGEN